MAEPQQENFFSNILAIVGFILVIAVVIWGLVHLASISRGWLSSLFAKSAVIEVTAPSDATSGTPFTLSWKYDEPAEGSYAFLYQCKSGFQILSQSERGNVGIPCGVAFIIPGTEKNVSLIPYLSGDAPLAAPLSVIFTPSATTSTSSGQAGTKAQGSVTVTIAPSSAITPAPTTPEPAAPEPQPVSPSTPASSAGSGQAGPADLSVRIISVSSDASGAATASFDIANVGGSQSGTYYFTAQLPTSAYGYLPAQAGGGSSYTYSSPLQSSLAPGGHIVSTLRFSQAQSGTFSISADPSNSILELNESNNYASQTVSAPYYNYQYTPSYYGTSQYNYGGSSYYPYNTYPNYNNYNYYQMYPYSFQNYPYNYNAYNYQYPYTYQYPYSTYYPYAY